MVNCYGEMIDPLRSSPEVLILHQEYKIDQMRKPLGTKAKTGEICPESGIWKVIGTPTTTAPISKGNKMPPYSDKGVTWELVQYA